MIFCLSGLVKTKAEAATEVNYKMQKKEITYKDGAKVRGIVSFQYPVLEGDSDQIAEINQVLADALNTYMASESAENIKSSTLFAIKDKMFNKDVPQYYWKTDCKVTYNKNNIISMHMKEMWYAGGVYNQTDYGYTFNVETGKALTAADAIGGTSRQMKNKILTGGKAYIKKKYKEGFDYTWQMVSDSLRSSDVKKLKFYLSPNKAHLCFGSYELGLGTDYNVFSVPSIYK
jgi:hypothetical protein